MQDRRSGEVHRSQHRVVWIVGIVCDCLAHQNVYSDVHQLEAYPRIMPKLWPPAAQIAAARNINRRILRHQVSVVVK